MTEAETRQKESKLKGFRRLTMEGKIRQDLKLVDSESEVAGIHTMDNKVRAIL